MARRTVDSKMLSLYLDWFYMCMHYMCIALARAPTWQSGRSTSVQAGFSVDWNARAFFCLGLSGLHCTLAIVL